MKDSNKNMEKKNYSRIYTDRKRFLSVIQGAVTAAFLVFIIAMVSASFSKDVPISQIESTMDQQPGISELMKKNNRDVNYFFGISPSQCVYYKSDNIMDVRELFIVKTSDADEMELALDAAAERLERQTENFTGYGTDQLEKLQHAITIQKGDYLFYGVGDEADEWLEAFQKLL